MILLPFRKYKCFDFPQICDYIACHIILGKSEGSSAGVSIVAVILGLIMILGIGYFAYRKKYNKGNSI